MPWCPKCRTEYREGYTVCSDCGSKLVDEAPAIQGKIYSDKAVKIMKTAYTIYRGIILIVIPALMVLSLSVCMSDKMQKIMIPNPALSIFDDMIEYTLYFCVYNYIFLFINHIIQSKIPQLKTDKTKLMNRIFKFYIILNTIFFVYYFYASFVYTNNVGGWHLFKNY